MAMSQRERTIGLITGVVLGILVIDHFALSPLLDQREQLREKKEAAEASLDHAKRLFSTRDLATKKWADVSGGALKADASSAESQIQNALLGWAQDAGLSLNSVKPERSNEKEKDFFKTTFRATGSGSMAEVGRFLFKIQTATVPARVTDITINSRKEGTDDLSVSIGVATIYLPPPSTDKPTPTATAMWEGR